MRPLLLIAFATLDVILAALVKVPALRLAGAILILLAIASLVALVVARLRRPWYRRPLRARMWYTGVHPLLQIRCWVTVTAAGEGLVVDLGRRRGRAVFKYGRLLRSSVVPSADGRWRILSTIYRDLTSQRDYAMQFAAQNTAPDELLGEIERRVFDFADVKWAAWRGLTLPLAVTADERIRGGFKNVRFTRKVACPQCGGVEGCNLACRHCGGKGAIIDNVLIRVKIPRRAAVGQQIVIPGEGHEDINGIRGALTLHLVDAPENASASA